MASRIYSLSLVLTTILLGLGLPINLPIVTVQAQTIQNRQAEAVRLIELGIQQLSKGSYREVLQSFQSALETYQAINDRKGEGNALSGIGYVYYKQGLYYKAIDYYQKSLAIFEQIGGLSGEVNLLRSNIASAYESLGDYDKRNTYRPYGLFSISNTNSTVQSSFLLARLDLFRSEITQQSTTLRAMENENGKCRKEYISDLSIKTMGDGKGEGIYLGGGRILANARLNEQIVANQEQKRDSYYSDNQLGVNYDILGKYDKAIKHYQKSLELSRQVVSHSGQELPLDERTLTLLNRLDSKQRLIALQKIEETKGQFQLASRAGDLYRQITNLNDEKASLNNLGLVYDSLGQYQKAIEYYQQSLAISKQYESISKQYDDLNSKLYALSPSTKESYDKLLATFQNKNHTSNGALLNNLGLAYKSLGENQKAIEYYQQSLAISKQTCNLSLEVASLNNLGNSFEAQKQSEIAILFYKQSVNVSESMVNYLNLQKDNEPTSNYVNSYKNLADLLLKQRRIIEAIQTLDLLKVQELSAYLKIIDGRTKIAKGVRLLEPEKAMSNQMSTIRNEQSIELNRQLSSQIQQLPKSEIDKVPDYLQKLPQSSVLLYPLILEDRLEIAIFAPNALPLHRTVPIKKAALEKLITDFRDDLQDFGSIDVNISSKKLYDILIKPIEPDLQQVKATAILYAPDGMFRYIPLSALYDGKQYLIEKYAVNNLTASILTDFTSKPAAKISVLAGAFGGKSNEKRFGQAALPASLIEVKAIQNIIQNSTTLVENNFSRKTLEAQLPNYNILHLATHANFNTGDPDDSLIFLGNGDTVSLWEISSLNLNNIDLIVLSACQTAVGKLSNGEEILGFGYQVQKAGAKAAIATLWIVNDEGTQNLMQAFYGYIKQGDLNKATALRQAQIDLIRGKQFSHPYYWSAFILIGNGL